METDKTYESVGYLIVRTVTAGGALPVEAANVSIIGADTQNKNIRITLLTDNRGQTPKTELPTPAASLSRLPGETAPYATYHIVAEKNGFYVAQALGVPIFENITAIQTLVLIPTSFLGDASIYPNVLDMVEETEPFQERGEVE